MLGHAALALLSVPPADMHLDAARLRVRESLLHDRVERARRSTTTSRPGPAPRSIPFASRVRCLVALGACRRRTALGPGLLAAGPASSFTLLSIGSARASFAESPGLGVPAGAPAAAYDHAGNACSAVVERTAQPSRGLPRLGLG